MMTERKRFDVDRVTGTALCWGFTAALAIVNIYYLTTLGETTIVSGREIARPVFIALSILFDVGLVWSTAAVLRHIDDRHVIGLAGAAALWALCAGISAHSASATLRMFTGTASGKASASLENVSIKRETLRNERDNLHQIQAELRKAPIRRRAEELRTQEAASQTRIADLERDVVKAASSEVQSAAPAAEFVQWVPYVLVGLPVLVVVASRRKEFARETMPVVTVQPTPFGGGWSDEQGAHEQGGAHDEQGAHEVKQLPAPDEFLPTREQGGAHLPLSRGAQGCSPLISNEKDGKVLPFKPRGEQGGAQGAQAGGAQVDEQAAQVRKLAAEGLSQVQIAKRLGVSRATVQRALKNPVKQPGDASFLEA